MGADVELDARRADRHRHRAASRASTSTCTTSASSPRSSPRSPRSPTGPSRLRGIAHIRGHETDRLAALATEINALGGDVDRDRGRAADHARARCTAGVFHTYDDHRMATAGAVLGLRVPGRRGRGHRDHRQDAARTSPTSGPACSRARWRRPLTARAAQPTTRTTSGSARAARLAAAHQGPRPAHDDAVDRRRGHASTAAATRLLGDGAGEPRSVTAMRARELGRKGVVVGDRVRWSATSPAADGPLARIVRVEPRDDGAAPHRRRHRPGRAGHRRQRRPARDRHRAGRPGAAPAADRPLPGRRLRRRPGAAARA